MCDCVDKVNKLLEPYNTCLTIPIVFSLVGELTRPEQVLVQTEKIDTKKRTGTAKKLFATYCPFCGNNYLDGQKGESNGCN
jgi:peptide deformylase